jgi:hypothetical protein
MVYKESSLCSWGSAFGHKSAELLSVCFINFFPKSLVPSQSLSPPATVEHLPSRHRSPEFKVWHCQKKKKERKKEKEEEENRNA